VALPRQNAVHAAARRLGAAGVPGVRLYWPLAERLAPWPASASSPYMAVGGGVPVVVTGKADFVGANVYRGLYERAEVRVFRKLLAPGDVFVDVGANLGYYTAIASRLVGPSGRVLAFEPSPLCFPRLSGLVDAGELGNVELFHTAVGAAAGASTLYGHGIDNSGASTLRADIGGDGGDGVEVSVVRLDDVVPAGEIAVVKVDTEGFEEQVLAGAAGLFDDARVRFAMVEVSPEFGPTDFAAAFVEGHPRYEAFAIAESGIPRRTRLRRLTPADIKSTPQQFNMLLARTDARTAIAPFIHA
jgi:FkbM family methyltransferase